MKKKLLLIAVSILSIFSVFALSLNLSANAAEKTDEQMVQEELNNIVLPEEVIFDFPVVYTSVYGSTIKWESSNEDVIDVPANGGWAKVNRQSEDKTVILTVTLTKGSYSNYKEFEITVPKGETLTSQYNLEYELNGGTLPENAPKKYYVGENLVLPTPTKGTVEFLGWYDNEELKGEKVEVIPTGTFGDVKYYAKWAESEITSIEIKQQPNKTEYNAKENFEKEGLVVIANYNDGTTVELSHNELTFDKETLHYGDNKVVVSYQGFTAEISVEVKQLEYQLNINLEEEYSLVYNGKEQTLDLSKVELPQGLKLEVIGAQKNVGQKELEIKFNNADEDYKTPESLYTTLKITKAQLTVTFKNVTLEAEKEIDESKFVVVFEGFVGEETYESLNQTLKYNYEIPQGNPAGSYTVTLSGLNYDNYEVTYVSGTLKLTTGTYRLDVQNDTVTYNGENQMFSVALYDGLTEVKVNFSYELDNQPFTGATNQGTYNVLVKYELEGKEVTEEVTFIIQRKSLESNMFNEIPEQNYTGQPITPEVSGSYNEKQLVLGKDFEILGYAENTDKGSARVTVRGLGNFTGELDLVFVIGESALEEVRDAKEELDASYEELETLPEELITESENGSKVTWFSTSTALSIDKDGKVTTIQTDKEQVVVVYALITNGDSAEYAMYEFTIPAKQAEKYSVTLQFETLHGEVTVSKSNEIEKGEKVNLTINPKAGYKLSSITVNGEAVSKDQREFTINENTTIKVVFEQYIYEDQETGIVTEGETSKLTVSVENKEEYVVSTNQQTLVVYDINFEGHDGKTLVTVKIPVPQGYENEDLLVYHLVNGEYIDMEAEKTDGYLVFTTSSFSPYVVTVKKEEENPTAPQLLASFNLVEDETSTGELKESSKELTEFNVENNGYTLTFTKLSKVYEAHDAKGNGCLKLGTSSVAGSFSFSVEANITKVIIYIGYRTKPVNVSINGTVYNITSAAYTPIEIDTTSTKTIELVTSKPASGDIRALVNTIEFYGGSSQGGQTPTPDPEEPTPTTYKVTLETSGQGEASVSKTEGIESGEKVTLIVSPSEGYVATVTVDGVETTEREFTITKDITISVEFVKEEVEEPTPDPEEPGTKQYVKVTSAPADWSGEYLIVYENGNNAYVFNGVDAANGYVSATINNGVIAYSEELAAVQVTIGSDNSLKINGKYMSGTSGSNKLNLGTSASSNKIELESTGVKITSNTSVLRFNSASDQMRFRYFKSTTYSSQKEIQLYKLVGSSSSTEDTTN